MANRSWFLLSPLGHSRPGRSVAELSSVCCKLDRDTLLTCDSSLSALDLDDMAGSSSPYGFRSWSVFEAMTERVGAGPCETARSFRCRVDRNARASRASTITQVSDDFRLSFTVITVISLTTRFYMGIPPVMMNVLGEMFLPSHIVCDIS